MLGDEPHLRTAAPDDPAVVLPHCRRLLSVGIGGGGDVVGALIALRALGRDGALGGLTWERRPVDPRPGPRPLAHLEGVRVLSPAVGLVDGDVRGPGGLVLAEVAMAAHRDEPTVVVDPGPGPDAVANGLAAACAHLGCDGVLLVDVGGDVLAHGQEAGLASPLADALLLAAAAPLHALGVPCALAVVGTGCDGELEPYEVAERIDEAADAGGLIAVLPVPEGALDDLDTACAAVITEASAMALACARGARGPAVIRGGRRSVLRTALGGRVVVLDPAATVAGPARLAAALAGVADLEAGEAQLAARGVRSELAWEREQSAAAD